ncbi:MAG: hypothetical protein E6Q97_23475 [Desulfurellales bacterium]|nr:MAG: hypothetical protein E6Q97_23475 [Desulfurellales bacterium]
MIRPVPTWPITMPQWMLPKLEHGRVLEVRRAITAGNSKPQRGTFADVDMDTAHPIPIMPAGYVRVRAMGPGGVRRSITLNSRVQPGDLLYAAGLGRTRAMPPALWVRTVRAERLHSITQAGLAASGVEDPDGNRIYQYAALVNSMPAATREKWIRTESHYRAQSVGALTWHLFAARWILDWGYGSWLRNSWVWVYTFRVVNLSAPAAASLAKSGALAQVAHAGTESDGMRATP